MEDGYNSAGGVKTRKKSDRERKMPKDIGLDWILHPFPRKIFFEKHYQKKPLIIRRQQMLNSTVDTTEYYADLFPMLGLAKCIDSFPQQRVNTEFVIVKKGFVTPPKFKSIHDAYGAYLDGHTLAAFIMNRLWMLTSIFELISEPVRLGSSTRDQQNYTRDPLGKRP